MFSRKSQLGPDALISVVLVAIIGLGGIFILMTTINSISMQGMITILDSEFDQRCFYSLSSIVGDEYLRSGKEIKTKDTQYLKMVEYFGGYNKYMDYSPSIESKAKAYSDLIKESGYREINDIYFFLAKEDKAEELRNEKKEEWSNSGYLITRYCFIPVYSPVGIKGSAEFLMSEAKGEEE